MLFEGSSLRRARVIYTGSSALLVAVAAVYVGGAPASSAATARTASCTAELAYDDGGAIALYDMATRRVWRLTHPDGKHFDGEPAWSPDGQRIAFSRERSYQPGFFEDGTVYTVDADGSHLHRRARGYLTPRWSPDGRDLLMDTGGVRDSPPAVVVVDDNRPPHWFPGGVFTASWTPDSRLLYPSFQPPGGLYVMNPDGSGSFRLAALPVQRLNIEDVSMSPDRRHVLVYEINGARYSVFDLVQRRFTQTIEQGGNEARPVWSPDGRQLAYARGNNIYVQNLGATRRRLVGAKDPYRIEWSHDGRSLAYIATGSHGHDHVFTVPAVGGHPIELVRATEFDWRPCS